MEIILDVTDLHIEFHDHDLPETAVEDFDLMLGKGEIVGIVGESGSGKTQVSLAVMGLYKRGAAASSGEMVFRGKNLLSCKRDELRHIQGCGIMSLPVKPVGVQELCPVHPQLGGPSVHQPGKAVRIPGHMAGQGVGGVVPGAQQQAAEEIQHRHGLPGEQSHTAALYPGPFRPDGDLLYRTAVLRRQQSRHDLGDAGNGQGYIRRPAEQHLTAPLLHQHS